ncbi:MAG: S8 family peptidase [Proteobacteria bacterium]|nr:S8 family peptidase [Pseudomonadota bacterium]
MQLDKMNKSKPLLIFPKPTRAEPSRRSGGPDGTPRPTKVEAQDRRITEQFEKIQAQFSNVPIDTEKVLVVETIGKVLNFHKAVEKIPHLEWLAEIDEDEIDLDIDEWYPQIDDGNREKLKKVGGRLYLVVSNNQAMNRLLGLWKKWKRASGEERDGFCGWKPIFELLHDLRFWNHSDMFRETMLLTNLWDNIKKGETVTGERDTKFEIELHYRKSEDAAEKAEHAVTVEIENIGGSVDQRVRINEVAFHALKITIPFAALQPFINNAPERGEISYLQPNYVKYCRPMAGVSIMIDNEGVKNKKFNLPPCNNELLPIIALLDGAPLTNHEYLVDRIYFDDPDNYSARYSSPNDRKHGTSMASLICHGDLQSSSRTSLIRKIYVRPVMIGQEGENGEEHFPSEFFLEDVLIRAVKHIKEGSKTESVQVVNLSLGIPQMPFFNTMSSLARVIDYLAAEYQLLFIISSGNEHSAHFPSTAPDSVIRELNQKQRDRKILSPSEAINAIAVGALNSDEYSALPPTSNITDLLSGYNAVALYSRLGDGFRKQIKPDIIVPGGRAYYKHNRTEDYWSINSESHQGIKHAYPDPDNLAVLDGYKNTFGTSNAAALTTHAAGEIYETLEAIRGESDTPFDKKYYALLLKALLVHGASRERISGIYENELKADIPRRWKSYFSRFVGYGIPDFQRVKECTNSRVVSLGCNSIYARQSDVYTLPIPAQCKKSEFVRVVVSLAWFSPISPRRQRYRQAKLLFKLNNNDASAERMEYDWQQVQSGTLQHEIFELKTSSLSNKLSIAVDCFPDAEEYLNKEVPYGLAVTLEVADSIEIYQDIKTSIGIPIST